MKRLLILLSFLTLVSCQGYKIGSLAHPQIKTVAILPVQNDTEEPLASYYLSEKLRERFMQDGSLRVVNSDEADIIIKGRLKNYNLEGTRSLRSQDDERDEGRHYASLSYKVEMTFEYEIKTRHNWDVQKKSVNGEARFAQFFDVESDKRNAVSRASYDIARKVVFGITEAW